MVTLSTTSRALIGEISQSDASTMVKAYGALPTETKSVWFSLEQIDQMVTLLKSEKLLNCGTDGLRIYFGTYTEDTLGEDEPASYIGMDTLVLVSTRSVVNSAGVTLYHEDYFDHLQMSTDKPGATPENRGELCQPNCSGATLP